MVVVFCILFFVFFCFVFFKSRVFLSFLNCSLIYFNVVKTKFQFTLVLTIALIKDAILKIFHFFLPSNFKSLGMI